MAPAHGTTIKAGTIIWSIRLFTRTFVIEGLVKGTLPCLFENATMGPHMGHGPIRLHGAHGAHGPSGPRRRLAGGRPAGRPAGGRLAAGRRRAQNIRKRPQIKNDFKLITIDRVSLLIESYTETLVGKYSPHVWPCRSSHFGLPARSSVTAGASFFKHLAGRALAMPRPDAPPS